MLPLYASRLFPFMQVSELEIALTQNKEWRGLARYRNQPDKLPHQL